MNVERGILVEVLITLFFVLFNIVQFRKNKEWILNYLQFLLVKWKLCSFLVAVLSLSSLSFFVNDPTWDVGISLIMGTTTFLFSPYSIFYFYQFIKSKKVDFNLFNSIFLLIFSSGWSYDIYNYLKNGHIPKSWFESLILSSIVYVVAGVFWNLAEENKRTFLSIERYSWPKVSSGIGIRTFLIYVLPIGILVSVFFLLFLYV